jgi:hypothetical protein
MPRYDEERLVRLLRMLRAAPREWIRRAQRIPIELGGRPSATLTARDVEELGRRLERDPSFRLQFDADPVAAVGEAGMHELGGRLRREIQELVALAERVARDEAYPADLAAPLLQVLGLPTEAPAELADVQAHTFGERPLEERLLLLLLTSRAVAEELRAAARGA